MRSSYLKAALMALVMGGSADAQQTEIRKEPRILVVNGTGTVQKAPDRAVIMVAVESRAATAQAAAQANATKMDAIYAALRRNGIIPPKVQTIAYALHPEYAHPDPRTGERGPPRVAGYVASNNVRVQVDSITRVGAIIDVVITAGANRVENLSFELRDAESARLEALRMAVTKARAEAEVIASAAGQRLGAPLSISSSGGYNPPPRPMYRMMETAMVDAAAPPTPVEPGNLAVTATVTITYELLQP